MRLIRLVFPGILLILFNQAATAQGSPCADGYIKSVTRVLHTKKDYQLALTMLLQMKEDCGRESLGYRSRKSLDSLILAVEKATGKIIKERIKDADGDGFADEVDKCPDVFSRFNNGCPALTSSIFSVPKMPQQIHVSDYTGQKEGRISFATKDTSRYDGYAKNDLLDGMGYLSFADGDSYTGEFKQGHFNGYGEYNYKDGSIYNGFWLGNQYHGIGRLKSKKDIAGCEGCKVYTGYFKNGQKSGAGRCYDADMHLLYEGMFENDLPSTPYPNKSLQPYTGAEIEVINLKDGGRFMGYTRNGKQEGRGTWRAGSKQEYVGEWENGFYEGHGTFLDEGIRYTGDWKKGVKNGFGTYDLGNGIIIIGAFKDDLLNGPGAILSVGQSPDIPLSPGCRYFAGTFVAGRKEGVGRCYDKSRKLIYDGPYKADRPVGKNYPGKEKK